MIKKMFYSGEKKKLLSSEKTKLFCSGAMIFKFFCDSLNLHCFSCLIILSRGAVRNRNQSILHNYTCFQRMSYDVQQDDFLKSLDQIRWILCFGNSILNFCLPYSELFLQPMMFCRIITNAINIFTEIFGMKQKFLCYSKCGRKVYYSIE